MIDLQRFAGHLVNYSIIRSACLPDDVSDELANDCPTNDSGRIINPAYRPKFMAWLHSENMPVDKCYIVWWSW